MLYFRLVGITSAHQHVPFAEASTKREAKEEEEDDFEKPLRYTTSKAAQWRARQTYSGGADDGPWFQPHVITVSLSVFLLYFCVFREESDIDNELQRTLYSRIEGLEKKQLEIRLRYNKEHGLDTEELEKRLMEVIEEEEAKKTELQSQDT